MTKEVKTTVVEYQDSLDEDFKPPSKWHYTNSLGQLVFLHVRSREAAQQYVDEQHGKGFFKVKTLSIDKSGSKEYSAVGVPTRRCFSPRLKGLK
tara:strand:+ start:654 stop:935 length:282 start_codon:yes stop_codon:yes gene_type:complete